MTEDILFAGKNPEGKIFTLEGSMKGLIAWADQFVNIDPDDPDEEYQLGSCEKDTSGTRFTQEERDANIQELKDLIDSIQSDGYKTIFLQCPRKKNGSLAKNRVTQLWRGHTFQHYWEDSYGFNAPEISVKNIGDYKAVLELTYRVVGY